MILYKHLLEPRWHTKHINIACHFAQFSSFLNSGHILFSWEFKFLRLMYRTHAFPESQAHHRYIHQVHKTKTKRGHQL